MAHSAGAFGDRTDQFDRATFATAADRARGLYLARTIVSLRSIFPGRFHLCSQLHRVQNRSALHSLKEDRAVPNRIGAGGKRVGLNRTGPGAKTNKLANDITVSNRNTAVLPPPDRHVERTWIISHQPHIGLLALARTHRDTVARRENRWTCNWRGATHCRIKLAFTRNHRSGWQRSTKAPSSSGTGMLPQ